MHTVEKYLISFLLKNFFTDTVHQVQKPIPKLQIPKIYFILYKKPCTLIIRAENKFPH